MKEGNQQMSEEFISRQISVYKNNKVLLEFQDKLKAASIPSYAHTMRMERPDRVDKKYIRLSVSR